MFYKAKKGQSILEYGILLGVIIAAILIMQVFVKRHFSGGIKESAERMGSDMFSTSDTTIFRKVSLQENQTIKEETATTKEIGKFLTADKAKTVVGTAAKGVYSFVDRSGKTETDERKRTDAATKEKFRWSEHSNTTYKDFSSTNLSGTGW